MECKIFSNTYKEPNFVNGLSHVYNISAIIGISKTNRTDTEGPSS